MTNIFFLLQCQYINKRKGYENISKGYLQEKLALIFNQILSTSSSMGISVENFFVVIGKDKKWNVPRCLSNHGFPLSCHFYVRTYVNFTRVNKIEPMLGQYMKGRA